MTARVWVDVHMLAGARVMRERLGAREMRERLTAFPLPRSVPGQGALCGAVEETVCRDQLQTHRRHGDSECPEGCRGSRSLIKSVCQRRASNSLPC